jgi:hypothetical protein
MSARITGKGLLLVVETLKIELDKVVDVAPPSPERQGQVSGHRRRISFGGLLNHDETRDDNRTTPFPCNIFI